MTKEEAKIRIEKLKKVINHHRYLYHVLDRQEISESALDSLKKELFDLEQEYPEFITPDSPTQRVGGKPLGKFKKFTHPAPMLSFNDAFSRKDMENWMERNLKLLTKEEASMVDFYCEPKLDGLAVEMIYKKGIFQTGATRGNGLIGEDVTSNLKTIESVPLKLREINEIEKDLGREGLERIAESVKKQELEEVIIRGEAIITKKDFEKVNKEQKKLGQPAFSNPRNLSAGSIRQLDPKITIKRRLDITAYDLISDFGQKTHEEKHKVLHSLGFKTNNKYSKNCRNLKEVFDFHDFWLKNRDSLPYEIDGLVISVNNNKIFEKLGVVGKAPRGAVAYKFPLKQATTIIEDIRVQVGRTGAITPVAVLKPVEISGVTVSRATLHNEDEIKRLGVKIGDTVVVGRAGDVIPDIIKVLADLRTGKEKEFKMPKNCPACSAKLIKPDGEVVWRCPNPKCFARQRGAFRHFVSKGAFDIAGLGPKLIDRLIDSGLVSDPADLFKLREGDILPMERFAEKSAQNLVEAIRSRRRITLAKFIYSLGIRNVGEETAHDLAERFHSFDELKKAGIEDLEKISDVGPVVARSIYDYFREKKNMDLLEKIKKAGVETESAKAGNLKLKGLVFVFTGGLEAIPREDAKEKVRLLGGEISESVSKQADYVVVGKAPGSKLDKAREFGIKTINEQQFLKIISR